MVIHVQFIKKGVLIQQNFIKCKTGAYIRFRGLDDSEKVKGITSFKKVILEEISQFDEEDLRQIKKCLRGSVGQQIVGIFNPISEDHWIKTNVFDKEAFVEQSHDISGKWVNKTGNTLVLKSNYTDNKYIVGPYFRDEHVIADFEHDKKFDFNYYQIYGLGNWGKIRTGGEFWKDFKTDVHVAKNDKNQLYNKELPICMSWDENVNPYLTCLLWQIDKTDQGIKLTQFDEICLTDPRNRVKRVCAEFMKRYPQQSVKGLFIYGDRTSIKEDTKKEKGENFFTDIANALSLYKPALRLPSSNPSVVQSANFINQIYSGSIPGIEITIGDNCKKSVHDYQYALEDSDGTLNKKKVKNKATGVTYEAFGHASDGKHYFIIGVLPNEYAEYLRGGRKVDMRVGKAIRSKNSYQ